VGCWRKRLLGQAAGQRIAAFPAAVRGRERLATLRGQLRRPAGQLTQARDSPVREKISSDSRADRRHTAVGEQAD
jgi:hypothetical protein